MGDGVITVRDDVQAYADGTVASVRVLSVPESACFPEGVKYAFHYGEVGVEHPVVRFDNHHGFHELHVGAKTYEIEYPGLRSLYRAWRAALPPEKRPDW